MQIKFSVIWMHYAVGIYRKSSIYQTDKFQFSQLNINSEIGEIRSLFIL